MNLIDRDALIECKFKNPISYNAFVNLVKRQPTIDAVEVVHCRECKWLHIVNDNILYGFCTKGHAMFYPFQLDSREFFCADGERRDPCS